VTALVEPPAPRRPWLTALGVVAVVALAGVLATAGGVAFLSDPSAPTPPVHDITSRQADPAPLTEAEVFPRSTVGDGYTLMNSQVSTDCRSVAAGALTDLLTAAGCSQVVRATLTSADRVYVATAGILNLRDEAAARQAAQGIQADLGPGRGKFLGYPPDAATRLGWDLQGHFLVYCVVARADGSAPGNVTPILDDLAERYLKETVIQARGGRG
jgi:hypothetical protein